MNRRQLLQLGCLSSAGVLAMPLSASAQPKGVKLQKDEVDAALERAVIYLRSKQAREGWINDTNQNRIALTALSILSMAAIGHQPSDKSPTGESMRKALAYVLDARFQDNAGYFGNSDGSRMYGHGIVSLMLGEMVGMAHDERTDELILKRLDKAIQLILRSQKQSKYNRRHQGGWRYTPAARDSDLSISVWQVMALRSAKNAGLDVPKKSIGDAVTYLKASYQSRRDNQGKPTTLVAGFGYQPGHGAVYSTTSAGMLALQVCGEYASPEVRGAADWLMKHRRQLSIRDSWFYYGTYYYAQGMYQRGGRYAEHARGEVERMLLPQQRKDGSWPPARGGHVYATTLAILSLSVKHHFLPIYQR